MKNLSKIIFILFLFNTNYSCFCQEENKFLLSEFDNDQYFDLFNFLVHKGECEPQEYSIISNRKLLEDSTIYGIYNFGIPGSHQISFLYFLGKSGKKEFINNYDSISILKELRLFYKKNRELFTEQKKIEYLKEIAEYLYLRDLAIKNREHLTIIN